VKEPRRLVDRGSDDFVCQLLQAWQAARPRARGLQKTAAAVGLAESAITSIAARAAVRGDAEGERATSTAPGPPEARAQPARWLTVALILGPVLAAVAYCAAW
jgi:hypothetical protein